MIYTVEKIGEFYVAKHFGREISKKKTLLQVTKALASYQKGRE